MPAHGGTGCAKLWKNKATKRTDRHKNEHRYRRRPPSARASAQAKAAQDAPRARGYAYRGGGVTDVVENVVEANAKKLTDNHGHEGVLCLLMYSKDK